MTLLQVISTLEGIAGQQPTVASIVRNDVFRLNSIPDASYGVFAWLQNEHTTSEDGRFIRWSFTLFYVDRLSADKANEVEVQSTGIDTLWNVLRTLEELDIYQGGAAFRSFTQRFSDECAGVFCTVTLETLAGTLCPFDYSALAGIREGVKIY